MSWRRGRRRCQVPSPPVGWVEVEQFDARYQKYKKAALASSAKWYGVGISQLKILCMHFFGGLAVVVEMSILLSMHDEVPSGVLFKTLRGILKKDMPHWFKTPPQAHTYLRVESTPEWLIRKPLLRAFLFLRTSYPVYLRSTQIVSHLGQLMS